MHLKFYGTAAAEGVPGMFCTCPVCANARKLGGKDIRTRSQALVDGKLLIDFPPDTYLHALHGGLDLPSITALLLTHSHGDHLYPKDLEMRQAGYAHVGEYGTVFREPLRIYATTQAMKAIRTEEFTAKLEANNIVQLHEILPFQPFEVDDFSITAVTAKHDPESGPVCWIIARGGKTMLYGNDTGFFPAETWDCFANTKPQFDFVALDCTGMDRKSYRGSHHMSLELNAQVRDRMAELGCIDEDTILCAHHFSHNGGLNHEALVKHAENYGFIVSYDGMEIEF